MIRRESDWWGQYCVQRVCDEVDYDAPKLKGLHDKKTTSRIVTERSRSLLAIEAYMSHIESVRVPGKL